MIISHRSIHAIDPFVELIVAVSFHPLVTLYALVYQAIVAVRQLVHRNVFHILNAHRTKHVLNSNALIHVLAVCAD